MNDHIKLFFDASDVDKDGLLNRDEVLELSETLLWIFRDVSDEEHLNSVSTFLHHANEYSEPDGSAGSQETYLSKESLRYSIHIYIKGREGDTRYRVFTNFFFVIIIFTG